jgi:tryptophanyl-tRNA synthetase
VQENTVDFLTHLAAMGLNLDAADVYSQWHRREVLSLAMEIGRSLKMGVINSALGVDMNSSVSRIFFPLVEVADILHRQRREHGGDRHTLVVHGLDQDVYVRLARQVAERMKFRKPAALYVRFVKGLKQYQDPVTGGLVDKMSSGSPNSALYYDDPPEALRRKIRRAVTGGDQDMGGNPDPRVCAVSSLMAFFTVPDTAEYEAICQECREHRLRCMDCKARCAEAMGDLVAGHQARIERGGLREQARQRVRALGI